MAEKRGGNEEASDKSSMLPVNRRRMLAAGAVGVGVGGGFTAFATDNGRQHDQSRSGATPDDDHTDEHDHGGETLGASDPVESLTAERVDASTFDATDATTASLAAEQAAATVLETEHLSIGATNRVDVVAESAIDHEGDLAAELMSYLKGKDVNHLFVLPAGTYSWNTEFKRSTFEFLGIVGAPQATLKIETHDPDYAFDVGGIAGGGEGMASDLAGERIVLKNLIVDITESDTHDAGLLHASVARSGLFENLRLRGRRNFHQKEESSSKEGGKFTVRVDTINPKGVSTIRNVFLPDGEVENPRTAYQQVIAFAADPPHKGTNIWEGCWVEGWTHGFYVMNNVGRNIIRGCTAKNNGNHNLTLGRNDVCRDSRIILSDASDPDRHTPGSGLMFKNGRPVVENLLIEAPDAWNGLVKVKKMADGGVLRDCEIHIGEKSPVRAIYVEPEKIPDEMIFENVTIFDESDGSPHSRHGSGSEYVVDVANPDVTFRDCYIESPERNGIKVRGQAPSGGLHIENCRFETGGTDLRFLESGSGHDIVMNRFSGDVGWDESLSEILWTGNRHEGEIDAGDAEDWNVSNNWGFDAEV